MKQLLLICSLLLAISTQAAASTETPLEPIPVNLKDKAALQRGAALFMNYCSGCHSLKYMRYSRMAEDLGLTTFSGEVDKDLLYNNLIFTESKEHDPIQIAMPKDDARTWFGVEPPDLSLTAREKGSAWIYKYLTSFYADNTRPFGANNLLVPGVAMPNVLLPLSGRRIAVMDKVDGKEVIDYLQTVEQGEGTPQQFDSSVRDLVHFLVYVSEPARLTRYYVGSGVLLFLVIFLIPAYLLKKTYWKAVKK
ncbi:cytochrome c1 [Legionella sp. W05-934-2]|jgi:ubiquinol-cytochrome c reductase cytochrome c1 subunit|uniref:cytochrome c1 n=1 Tax=Legionella sp. W05-934-2 TaxID=1198649 RepID=UPI003463591E